MEDGSIAIAEDFTVMLCYSIVTAAGNDGAEADYITSTIIPEYTE